MSQFPGTEEYSSVLYTTLATLVQSSPSSTGQMKCIIGGFTLSLANELSLQGHLSDMDVLECVDKLWRLHHESPELPVMEILSRMVELSRERNLPGLVEALENQTKMMSGGELGQLHGEFLVYIKPRLKLPFAKLEHFQRNIKPHHKTRLSYMRTNTSPVLPGTSLKTLDQTFL